MDDYKQEARAALALAHDRAARRDNEAVRVDYDALNRMVRRQRAALTRAVNSGDRDRVVIAVRDAVREWNQPGAIWPDDWTAWQRALNDALPLREHVDIADLA
jgi:thioesterase domain-containing protein